MRRPAPRGPLTTALLTALDGPPGPVPALADAARTAVAASADVLADDDVQLALLVLYELHHRGVDGVDDAWEWQPDLIAARVVLEEAFESVLRELVPVPDTPARSAVDVASALFALAAADDGPSLAAYLARRATDDQLHEFFVLKSVYHLKEADPHSWALTRITGRSKSALVEIQADEYGAGRPGYLHHELFARSLRALGLDDAHGAYLDLVPGTTLATVNLMGLLGLHRRLRGAIVGHLAAFEMTSSVPCGQVARGIRRLGYGDDVAHYYDEHVEADAVHEQIAGRDLAGALAQDDPAVRDDVLWGAAVCLALDARAGAAVLDAWEHGRSALRHPVAVAA